MFLVISFILLAPGMVSVRILWNKKAIEYQDYRIIIADYVIYSFLIQMAVYGFMFFTNPSRTVSFIPNIDAISHVLSAGFVFKYSFMALILALILPFFISQVISFCSNTKAIEGESINKKSVATNTLPKKGKQPLTFKTVALFFSVIGIIFVTYLITDRNTQSTVSQDSYDIQKEDDSVVFRDINAQSTVSQDSYDIPKEDEGVVFRDIPVLIINTHDAVIGDDFINTTITLANTGNVEFEFEDASAEIRLRGNTTRGLPKRPYRLRFEENTSMFGSNAHRNWVLLAHYWDTSNLKNWGAYTLAQQLEHQSFAPLAIHVEVFLNGEFQGLYMLSDHIAADEGRVDVRTEELNDDDLAFAIELDHNERYGVMGEEIFMLPSMNDTARYFSFRYPDSDDMTQEHFNAIYEYVAVVNDLIFSNSDFELLNTLIDVESFIDFYLLQEFFGQKEINWKSVNMYKAQGGKMRMGPVWDFDWAVGRGPQYDTLGISSSWFSSDNWFRGLMQNLTFNSMVQQRWDEIRDKFEMHIVTMAEKSVVIREATLRDQKLWHSEKETLLFQASVQTVSVIDFLSNRIIIMDSLIENLPTQNVEME